MLIQPDDIDDADGFARGLTALREAAGLTIRQVAAKVGPGVPHTTVGGWFAGHGLPSVALRGVLVDVLQACGVDTGEEREQWLSAWERVRRAPGRRGATAAPYRGLGRYEPEDADWFFGRQALTARLLEDLSALERDGGGLLLVVGASGAGKSSVLRAGVVAAVRSGRWPSGHNRTVVLTTPAATALPELRRQVSAAGDRPIVIIDQLEEIFTGCPSAAEREAYIDAVTAVASGPQSSTVVLGLRADFYAQALQFPALRDAAQRRQVAVGPMSPAELRAAITDPARKAGLDIEDGFAEAVLHDLAPSDTHVAGTLPLLSHALFVTWRTGRGRRLKVADYRAAGGIRGAVAESADAVYQALTAREKQYARRIFLNLVHVDAEGASTRRRVGRDALVAHLETEQASATADVIDQFVAQRLITADVDAVELSHEALLTAWPQLAAWIDAGRADLLTGRQLAQLARDWREDGRHPDALLRGTRLASAQAWIRDHPHDGTQDLQEFLDMSTRHEQRRIRRLRQALAVLVALVLLAAAGAMSAVAARNAADTLRATAVSERNEALSRLVANRADELRTRDSSLSAQLALAAYRIAPTTEARSSMIGATGTALASRLVDPDGNGVVPAAALSPDGRTAVTLRNTALRVWRFDATQHPHLAATAQTPVPGSFTAVSFSPDGVLLAAGTDTGSVQLWNVADPAAPRLVRAATAAPPGAVFGAVFDAIGRTLATTGHDTAQLWDTTAAALIPTTAIPVGTAVLKSVALSADGRVLATGDARGSVLLFDLTDRDHPLQVGTATGPTAETGQVAVSPDGHLLAAGGRDNIVFVWDITDPAHPRLQHRLTGAKSWINAVAFTNDGTLLAAGSSDTAVGTRLWNATNGQLVATLPHPAPVTSVTFDATGTQVLTSANDGITRRWPVHGPQLPAYGVLSSAAFSRHGAILAVGGAADMRLWNTIDPQSPAPYGPVTAVPGGFAGTFSFTPDDHTLAVSYGAGHGVGLWDITAPAQPAPLEPPLDTGPQLTEAVTFSPDGRLLATASNDGTVQLWDVATPTRPARIAVLSGFTSYVMSVTFSPDGRILAAGSADKSVRLWDIRQPSRPAQLGTPLQAGDHYVYSVVISPDGRTLAAGSADSTIRLWDITDPAQPRPLTTPLAGPTDYVYLLAFNPNGQTLAAATTDGGVWLWNTTDPRHPTLRAAIALSADALYTVGFHPDGSTLAAGGAAGMATILTTDPERTATQICDSTGSSITRAEWDRYVPGRQYDPPCR
ncbi:AAA family ATPase [Dactylosporangium sp. CA-092794]|uniref:nSTAND1 domain-containing NTPase n=1 Tax=Dactylosporangium sp. CA-092794 TaxID=3239929 RepID=UPI003D93CD38